MSTQTESKKDQIIALYESGETDVSTIARAVKARPSYICAVLQNAGHLEASCGIYNGAIQEVEIYSRFFRNVLSLESEESARESVAKIDRLYSYFERLGDRAGQHQTMVLALAGKNRARWSGKIEVAEMFSEWLASH